MSYRTGKQFETIKMIDQNEFHSDYHLAFGKTGPPTLHTLLEEQRTSMMKFIKQL